MEHPAEQGTCQDVALCTGLTQAFQWHVCCALRVGARFVGSSVEDPICELRPLETSLAHRTPGIAAFEKRGEDEKKLQRLVPPDLAAAKMLRNRNRGMRAIEGGVGTSESRAGRNYLRSSWRMFFLHFRLFYGFLLKKRKVLSKREGQTKNTKINCIPAQKSNALYPSRFLMR